MENTYKYVFVILVYKNTSDLENCLKTINKNVRQSHKSIVVNAYFDDYTKAASEKVANKYDCDFINIENKGYSYGNNKGIQLAKDHYHFEYIVVCNPDVEILEFDDRYLNESFEYDIIAPRITTLSGKRQNPMATKRNRITEYLEYWGFKTRIMPLVFGGILISKISRFFGIAVKKIKGQNIYPIHCVHGSFVIFSRKAISKLIPVYDEKIFLFAEEGILATRASTLDIKCCYYDFVKILHKEDGSMKLSDFSINEILRESNLYYLETYVMSKKRRE